jgi:hypothetical protein
MMWKQFHPLFLLFLAIAAIGLVQLILTPLELLYTILLYGAGILIFVAIYRYIIKKKQSGYKRNNGAPPSKFFSLQKKEPFSSQIKKGKHLKQKKKRTTDHPFTVIEGNKGKKKKPHSS